MPKKKIDRNTFLMSVGPARADAIMRAALKKRNMHLNGVDDFDAAMGAICELFIYAYSKGMCDTIDALIDGTPLEEIRE